MLELSEVEYRATWRGSSMHDWMFWMSSPDDCVEKIRPVAADTFLLNLRRK